MNPQCPDSPVDSGDGQRDRTGRFVAGHKGIGGRPRICSMLALNELASDVASREVSAEILEKLIQRAIARAMEDDTMLRWFLGQCFGSADPFVREGIKAAHKMLDQFEQDRAEESDGRSRRV